MKISELIYKLKEINKEYGDVEVITYNEDASLDSLNKIRTGYLSNHFSFYDDKEDLIEYYNSYYCCEEDKENLNEAIDNILPVVYINSQSW